MTEREIEEQIKQYTNEASKWAMAVMNSPHLRLAGDCCTCGEVFCECLRCHDCEGKAEGCKRP